MEGALVPESQKHFLMDMVFLLLSSYAPVLVKKIKKIANKIGKLEIFIQ
jgi:hypothetical protein